MDDVSGIHSLQQSLVIGSFVKMLMHRVLSDRYRITQEQFQYLHGTGIFLCYSSCYKDLQKFESS